MQQSQKIIAVVGPTASGKSELAVKLALRLPSIRPRTSRSGQAKKYGINGAEIISADSRQIYKGLDIGSGKVKGLWRRIKIKELGNKNEYLYKKIRHYCIDIVSPKKVFTVVNFKKCAKKAINDIAGRGKIPILCGGTGFWIDAVIYNLPIPNAPSNKKLRQELSKKSANELFKILKKLDPRRAKTIDPKNPHRLMRAIEIIKYTKKPIPELKKPYPAYDTLFIGIKTSKEKLIEKINKRLEQRLKKGMVAEVKSLIKNGVPKKRLYGLGLEYRFITMFLDKKLSKKEMVEKLKKEIRQYAKRQMTWFKRNKNIYWITSDKEATKRMDQFFKHKI